MSDRLGKESASCCNLRNMFRTGSLLRSKAWLYVLSSVVAAIGCYTPFLYFKSFDLESLAYLALLLLIALTLGFFVILRGIFYKKWVKRRRWIAALAFLGVSFAMSHSETRLRPWARWLVSSSNYKKQVLAQPMVDPSGMRLIEWDAWGWAGMETGAYLIYDPSDTLKFGTSGVQGKKKSLEIIEKSQFIQRLGNNWYSATLYTDQYLYTEE